MERQDDHYSYLGLEPFAPTEEVDATVERLRKQAAALANTSPARAQEVWTRLRQIQHDLLTTEERRAAYDNDLVVAMHRRRAQDMEDMLVASPWETDGRETSRVTVWATDQDGFDTPPDPASSVASRRNMLLVGGLALLVVLAAAGGGFATARSALGPHSTATPASTPVPILPAKTSAPSVRPVPHGTLRPVSRPTSTPLPQVTPTPPPQPTSAPSLDSSTATSTVSEFYADINSHEYSSAYALLGTQWHRQQSYSNFANGFSRTARDDLTIVSTEPAGSGRYRVSVTLDATQRDGSVQHYFGGYTVGLEQGEPRLLQGNLSLSGS